VWHNLNAKTPSCKVAKKANIFAPLRLGALALKSSLCWQDRHRCRIHSSASTTSAAATAARSSATSVAAFRRDHHTRTRREVRASARHRFQELCLVRERDRDIALANGDSHCVAINTFDGALQLEGAVPASAATRAKAASTALPTLASLSELLTHLVRACEPGGVTHLVTAKAGRTADHNRHN
jgi:hypothetical protein